MKLLGREAYHSLLSSAKVKNAWSWISITRYDFMGWGGVLHN